MSQFDFFQLDVFTDTPLTGNPLAVVPDASGLTDSQMQAVAREMNLSETSFVLESTVATKRVRFFTPTSEIPLAGHPSIGTWWLLAERGLIELPQQGDLRVTQETLAGTLPVDLFIAGGRPERVIMTQASPEFGEATDDTATLGRVLGGSTTTVRDDLLPQVVSTGLPQLMIPISSLSELKSLPSGGAGSDLVAFLKKMGTDCAECFVIDSDEGNVVRTRMFAPGLGIPEDPATGSAAGALGAYLVWHGIIRPSDGVASISVLQGEEIDRPSRIEVEVAVGNGGEITEVRVGGTATTVVEGRVTI